MHRQSLKMLTSVYRLKVVTQDMDVVMRVHVVCVYSISLGVINVTHTVIICSARVRQDGSGVAQIQLLLDGSDVSQKCPLLRNPYPALQSWQWVGCNLAISGSNLTIVMNVTEVNTGQVGTSTAYFDDICVTFTTKGVDEGK